MWKGERRGTSHNDIFYNDAKAFFKTSGENDMWIVCYCSSLTV